MEVEVVAADESLLLELGFIVDNCVREGSVLLSFIGLQHSTLSSRGNPWVKTRFL